MSHFCGHSPQGECGLKLVRFGELALGLRHSPQGECGLKFHTHIDDLVEGLSLPARGVWIEIFQVWSVFRIGLRHSPQGECGLKYIGLVSFVDCLLSLPARGVWIEIYAIVDHSDGVYVTPRKGSVD